jgi:hypothetical protein
VEATIVPPNILHYTSRTVVVVAVTVACSSCTGRTNRVINLPTPDMVEKISATSYPGPDAGPTVSDLSLTVDDYSHIRNLVQGARLARDWSDLTVKMGVIRLTLKDGNQVVLNYFWAGEPSVFLTLDGQDSVFKADDKRGRDLGVVITYYLRDKAQKDQKTK